MSYSQQKSCEQKQVQYFSFTVKKQKEKKLYLKKSMRKQKYEKINTFTRTPSFAQISAYVIVGLDIIVYYVMVQTKFMDETTRIVMNVLFSCSIISMLIPTILCSIIDPSDSIMIDCKQGNSAKYASSMDTLLYCDLCQAYVAENSRHCRQCQRCVENFDHHCMWINNCVGSKNYRSFAFMIACTFFHLLLYVVATILLTTENLWSQFLFFMVPSWIVMGIICILWVLLLNLIILHIYLNCKGYTTYQFIVARREQERQEEEEKILAKQKEEQDKMKAVLEEQKLKLSKRNANAKNKLQIEQQSIQQKINVKAKQSIINVDSEDSQDKIENKNLKEDSKDGTMNQNSRELMKRVVFDQQQCTEKSVEIQQKFDAKKKSIEEAVDIQSNEDDIRISSFFTRNKSFNLLMSQDVAKPHKNLNSSAVVTSMDRKTEKTKTFAKDREVKLKVKKSKTSNKQ